uniref:uncharacterized protein LOC122601033 n=1 Tax=Erigeron canadensis TaxID=72917 RepID=UPI001CB8EDC4|nr:uncharacterized protein LOC122601033 [Erigeron canadensis]
MEFRVINDVPKTPGGIKFEKEIGIPFTKQILPKIINYIWSTLFQQNNPSERKNIDVLQVFITKIDEKPTPVGVAYGNTINISVDFIQETKTEEMKWYFTAVMLHEATHVFQWNGEWECPSGLREGVAEYAMLKANYVKPNFLKPGEGDRWDQGYAFTARFLEYCEGLVPGFVAKLNKKMRKTYNVLYFKEITGKSVEQLWMDYKAKYGKKN